MPMDWFVTTPNQKKPIRHDVLAYALRYTGHIAVQIGRATFNSTDYADIIAQRRPDLQRTRD